MWKGQNVGHQVSVRLICTRLAHMAHVLALCAPDLFVLWKESSTAKVQSRWVQWSLSKVGTISIRRYQPSLHNHRWQWRAFFTSRLGTLGILLPARLMHWSAMSALQGYQALHSMFLPCASIGGIPVWIGPSRSQTLICSECMVAARI